MEVPAYIAIILQVITPQTICADIHMDLKVMMFYRYHLILNLNIYQVPFLKPLDIPASVDSHVPGMDIKNREKV